jgi:hypothetical protein
MLHVYRHKEIKHSHSEHIDIVAYFLKAEFWSQERRPFAREWLYKQRPLLSNGSVAITLSPKQKWTQTFHCNRGEVFSTRSLARCYKQDRLEVAVAFSGPLGLSRCEVLLLEAGSWDRKQNGSPKDCWKQLPSNGNEDVTVGTSVCM